MNVWLGFATDYNTGRFAEGDLVLIYDHPPNGAIENKVFAWFGPVDLSEAEIAEYQRDDTGVKKRLDKDALPGKTAAYILDAFDKTTHKTADEIPVLEKNEIVAAIVTVEPKAIVDVEPK